MDAHTNVIAIEIDMNERYILRKSGKRYIKKATTIPFKLAILSNYRQLHTEAYSERE